MLGRSVNLPFCQQNKIIFYEGRGIVRQGILKGDVSLYHWPPVWLIWISRFANKNKNCQLSYSWFKTSQTGGKQYSDTSSFSIPWVRWRGQRGIGAWLAGFWGNEVSTVLSSKLECLLLSMQYQPGATFCRTSFTNWNKLWAEFSTTHVSGFSMLFNNTY